MLLKGLNTMNDPKLIIVSWNRGNLESSYQKRESKRETVKQKKALQFYAGTIKDILSRAKHS